MKISERCEKQIEDIEKLANECKIKGDHEPYKIVFWDRDFESISELYIAYKLLIDANNELQKAYIADFEESEDRCATLEAENEKLKEQVKGLHKECRNLHNTINILRADNSNQSHELHKLKTDFREHLNALEAENEDLKDKLDIVSENLNNHIIELKDKLYKADEENKKLKEKVGELHTIKKSFEVLRALYLGDYENDEPF